MAKKVKAPKEVKGANLIAAAVAQFEALMREHIGEILDFLHESEDKSVTVNNATKFNLAESEPQVESTLRFSQAVTDKRTSVLDNPDQGSFRPLIEQAEDETKKQREERLAAATGEKPKSSKKKTAKKLAESESEAPQTPDGEEPQTT